MTLPFEFVIGGPPVSQQTRRRERVREWTAEVEDAARKTWDTEPPVAGAIMVTIAYFFDGTPFDVDNIPKPILDALKGMVFNDDVQVFDLLCRKRDINENLQIQNPSPELIEYLRESKQVLHISVADVLNREVSFW